MNNKKDLYIDNSLIISSKGNPLFDDIYIEHNSLPEINFEDIDTKINFLGKEISFPLIINSMTGGTERGLEINEILLTLTKELNLPLALGSQQEEIDDEEKNKLFIGNIEDDFKSDNIILSNLGAKTNLENIEKAMKLVNANGISLYLNSAQEVISFDGDKNFENILANLKVISNIYNEKLIIKEKGMGMSKKTIQSLVDIGVKYIDVSGYGGTNFIEIENLRNYRNDFSDLYGWGIPTAKSIINAREVSDDLFIISSGGVKTGLDVVKSIIIGSDCVGVSGELLRYIVHGGYEQGKKYLEDLIYKTKIVMFLLGVKNIEELKSIEYKITGKLKEIL